MGVWDIAILVFVIIVVIVLVVFLLNRWASKRLVEQKSLIESNRQSASIYVIDKKRDRIQNINFPKAVQEQVPRWNKLVKMYFVKAKIGPQIMTLMCDKEVFNSLPLKKTVNVDLAGIYIAAIKGAKNKRGAAPKSDAAPDLPWYKKLLRR